MHFAGERSQFEKTTYWLYDTLKRQNSGNSKQVSGCQQLGRAEGWTDRAQRIFWSTEITLHDAIIVDADHYAFLETRRMYNIKNEPEC